MEIKTDTDFDIGNRGITVEFDKPRELVYTLGAFRAMADLAHSWAKRSGIIIRDIVGPAMLQAIGPDGNVIVGPDGKVREVPNPAIITAGTILRNLGDDTFLSIALWGALRKDNPKMKLEEVDEQYEIFLEKGGDRDDLVAVLVEAFARARNPHRLQQARELEKTQAETKDKAEGLGPSGEPIAKAG